MSECKKCFGVGVLWGREPTLCDCACAACAACGGLGWLWSTGQGPGPGGTVLTYEKSAPCKCALPPHRLARWKAAGVPSRYWHAGLASPPDAPPLDRWLFRWLARWNPGASGVWLHGPVGTGKTHAMIGALRAIVSLRVVGTGLPPKVQYVDVGLLLSQLKAEISTGGVEPRLRRLRSVSLLVLDELGRGRLTPWEMEILGDIIGHRYNEKRTTCVVANYSPAELRVRLADAADIAGERLVDRLVEVTEPYHLAGASRRGPTH